MSEKDRRRRRAPCKLGRASAVTALVAVAVIGLHLTARASLSIDDMERTRGARRARDATGQFTCRGLALT